jgi:DNA-binding XRE family transcriptional regulator
MPTNTVTLDQAREDAGMTQAELADAIGVSRGTYWNWEAQRCAVGPNEHRLLAKALGVPARRLAQ